MIAGTLAANGYRSAALATLVAFAALLRINEFIHLTIRDVALPDDPRLGIVGSTTHTVLHIPHAKTGKNQSATIHDPHIISLLSRFMSLRRNSGASLDDSLFNIESDSIFRHAFNRVLGLLELTHCHFVPHSLRHGGATHALNHGAEMATVLQRGRWRSTKSAGLYLQQASASRLATVIPDHICRLAKELTDTFPESFIIKFFDD